MTPQNTALADELLAMARRRQAALRRLPCRIGGGAHRARRTADRNHRRAWLPLDAARRRRGRTGRLAHRPARDRLPALQQSALPLLRELVANGELLSAYLAMLEDRIRCFEGKSQCFGTQFDWDEAGQLSPLPIEDLSIVEARRAEVGLPLLQNSIDSQRRLASEQGRQPSRDPVKYEAEREAWLRRVGWRE